MHRKPTNMTILIADDDHDDRLFMEQALRQNGFAQTIQFVEDGEELMEYLRGEGRFADQNVPWPNLLILDLNMPIKDGRETLRELKADPRFRHIPTIVFTTSSSGRDRKMAYKLGANCFITKPDTFNGLVETTKCIANLWLE